MAATTTSQASRKQNRLSNADLDRKIVSLGRKGKTDEALKVFDSIEQPSIRIINGAIDACARARPTRLEKAFEIFERATSAKSKYALKPNVFTFGSLMNACNRARNVDKAMKTLRSMEKDYGVVPNAIVYSSAISACARSDPPKPELALKLLKEVVEEKKLSMSVVGFNAAISACAQASDWENAIGLLTRMEEATINRTKDDNEDIGSVGENFIVPEPDVVTYGTVLAACERGGKWKLILKNAESMQERGLPLDGLSVMTCLHACAELGLAYEGLRYLDMMKSVKEVTQRTARYQRHGARKPLVGPDAVAYRCAISACARGGAWREGIRLLQECKDFTGTPANTVAYTAAITGCEYAGEWKEAFFLLDKMRKEGVEPNELTMGAVIGACATACTRDENKEPGSTTMPLPQKKAIQLLSLMKKDPSIVKPNIQVYNAAIRVCAEAFDTKRAFRILEDAKESGIERTQFTYGSLMTACERNSCVESASKAFRMMREDNIQANEIIYGAAISCCRKAKESERTLLLLRKMIKEELSPNAATLNTVMLAQTDSGKASDSENVLKVYKLMKSQFVDDRGRPNRYTYSILINYFAEIGKPAAAEAFLDKMRKDGFKPDVDLFTTTVTAYERAHQPLKALNLMESMQNDGYDFYGVKVFDAAFKNGVKVLNAVGQNFAASDEEKLRISRRLNQTETYDDDNEGDDDTGEQLMMKY
jgi:pentatricopeptide repeat domain-containing protein 1